MARVSALRKDREDMAHLAAADSPEDPLSVKACWVLDLAVEKDPMAFFPYLGQFIGGLGKIRNESAIRPLARICEQVSQRYYASPATERRRLATPKDLEALVAAAFNWLIGPHKVAAKVYSMTTLYHLGLDFNWIHRELELVLEKNYPEESAAYKARARMILAKIKAQPLVKKGADCDPTFLSN